MTVFLLQQFSCWFFLLKFQSQISHDMRIESVRIDPNDGRAIAVGEYQMVEVPQRKPYPFLAYVDGKLFDEFANLTSAFEMIRCLESKKDGGDFLWEFNLEQKNHHL